MSEARRWRSSPALFNIVVVGLALPLLWLTVSSTVANSVQRVRPDIAVRFVPFQSYALARLAENIQIEDVTPQSFMKAVAPARSALERDPTHAVAVRALGFAEDGRGQIVRAAQFMRFADRLSRRDLPTELWLVEYNVKRGDVPEVLKHFDAAISTSPEAMSILFPVLINALSDAQLVQPIANMLKRQPWWVASFLNQTALQAPSTDNAAALFLTLAKAGHPVRRDIVEKLSQRIRTQGQAAIADRLVRDASEPN